MDAKQYAHDLVVCFGVPDAIEQVRIDEEMTEAAKALVLTEINKVEIEWWAANRLV